MAKFVAYFGKNSNGPAKKIGDHIHSGLSLTPFGKKTKNIYVCMSVCSIIYTRTDSNGWLDCGWLECRLERRSSPPLLPLKMLRSVS